MSNPTSTDTTPDMQKIGDDHGTPGHQERPMTDDEKLEKSLEDSFLM